MTQPCVMANRFPLLVFALAAVHLRLRQELRAASAVIFSGDPTGGEWTNAGFAIIWALVLASSGSTFATSPVYELLKILPEGAWAYLFGAFGTLTMVAWRLDRRRVRLACLLFGAGLWLSMTAAMVKAAPSATGWVYLVPWAASSVCYLRLRAQASP